MTFCMVFLRQSHRFNMRTASVYEMFWFEKAAAQGNEKAKENVYKLKTGLGLP